MKGDAMNNMNKAYVFAGFRAPLRLSSTSASRKPQRDARSPATLASLFAGVIAFLSPLHAYGTPPLQSTANVYLQHCSSWSTIPTVSEVVIGYWTTNPQHDAASEAAFDAAAKLPQVQHHKSAPYPGRWDE
jgi:hypothetical protein